MFDPLELAALPLSAYTPGQGDRLMEGGWETASGAPVYPFEWYLRGDAPYVTGATSNKKMMGQTVYRKIGEDVVPVKITDYGPGVKGIDIASVNKEWGKNFPYQGQKDNMVFAGPSIGSPSRSALLTGVSRSAPAVAGGTGPMSTWEDYGKVLLAQNRANAAGSAIGSAFANLGQGISQSGQQGMQQAMQMLQQRRSPFDAYLQSLLNPGGFI